MSKFQIYDLGGLTLSHEACSLTIKLGNMNLSTNYFWESINRVNFEGRALSSALLERALQVYREFIKPQTIYYVGIHCGQFDKDEMKCCFFEKNMSDLSEAIPAVIKKSDFSEMTRARLFGMLKGAKNELGYEVYQLVFELWENENVVQMHDRTTFFNSFYGMRGDLGYLLGSINNVTYMSSFCEYSNDGKIVYFG